ncbi:hypothetical protein PACTADRAFT_47698 [Pachysolen tannophilus NRRL Y-2460]|uniref:F-box domain-containing protein n=1 Tax=Pachysolen tannophilus NRRL Y-2460 TaxID=669874 RepID=A0A1E4U1H4_PACTA|nr:hypothetical protein PACTADRAFT_47698 [Pachysolen tannophilus NRRL Y-2460]
MVIRTINDLPQDIWLLLVKEFLDEKDLVNLIQVNKDFNRTLTSNDIWRHLTLRKWFDNDYSNKEDLDRVGDYMRYYKSRSIIDQEIEQLVLNENANNDFILLSLENYKENCIPKLVELCDHYNKKEPKEFLMKRRLNHLSTIFRANYLLNFFKYKKIYDLLYSIVPGNSNNNNKIKFSEKSMEEILLILNNVDTYYYELLPYRKKVIDRVISEYLRVVNTPEYSYLLYKKKATQLVLLIVKIFFTVVKLPAHIENRTLTCIEDLMILRVYSGDIRGNHISLCSIISHICDKLGFKTYLTRSFFVVEDENFDEKRSYFFIKRSSAKVYDHCQVLNILRSNGVVQEKEVRQYFKRLTVLNLISNFFDSIDKHASVDTLELQDSANAAFTDRNDEIAKMLSLRLCSLDKNDIFYFRAIYKALLLMSPQNEWGNDSINEQNEISSTKNSFFVQLFCDTVINKIARYCPIQAFHIARMNMKVSGIEEILINFKKSYKLIPNFHETYNMVANRRINSDISKPEDKINPPYYVGDVLYHSRSEQDCIVVGWHYKTSYKTVILYYVCYTANGTIEVYEQSSIHKADYQDEIFSYQVTKFAEKDLLGLFFKKFDWNQKRFLCNDMLLELYPDL